jgi:hypothetical protein
VWTEIKANVRSHGKFQFSQGSANGLGDILIFPVMLGWTRGNWRWQTQLNVFAPTGNFKVGRLANLGKNFWTFGPAAGISYLSLANGLEATAFAGIDFNTRNHATAYQSGEQFHLDATSAYHLPILGGIGGLGAQVFYYQQITPDGGSGAGLGSFESSTVGIGPVLSYVTQFGKVQFIGEVKWLPELDSNHRLQGQSEWLKLILVFGGDLL